ncbi:MAG: glutamine synthetase III [Clostridia bacterium]
MSVIDINEIFASNVFNEKVMKEMLPASAFESLKKTIDNGQPLDKSVAQIVANSMKDWAIKKGATHYTHWFQPMNSITAEKHDAFISLSKDDNVIMEFSGKELLKGEPDASSFPSGGLRSTFEARGYTAWDPTSYAFIKNDILCIPTAFCSYQGDVLDKKTPLLKSISAVTTNAERVLKILGAKDTKTVCEVGAEQEYFLIDRDLFLQRNDLKLTGKTLFGAKPPKGQELDDHYFGTLKERVANYMKELNIELWKLGIFAKTQHNEVAPGQHELAPIYTTANIATDHNQLTMELMKRIARHHNLVCLLNEKPFDYVNGSGKHNNWSLSAGGRSLFKPQGNPNGDNQFLLFLSAFIRATHKYSDLLRMTTATAGNDHRLGGNEAPPAIVSIFLGDEITNILYSIAYNNEISSIEKRLFETGVSSIPKFGTDSTDRNRTSPLAFTGNKFEFRMVGSSQSIAGANIIINTAVADVLSEFATRLENASDIHIEIENIIRDTIVENGAIIYNGNSYSDEWVIEAKRRGLSNFKTTPEALPAFIEKKSVDLFARQKVFTKTELLSRYEILMDEYTKVINIEALTMLEMAKREIFPACIKYENELLTNINQIKKLELRQLLYKNVYDTFIKIQGLTEDLLECTSNLEFVVNNYDESYTSLRKSMYQRDNVIPVMAKLREVADELETYVANDFWPFPTYKELLFSV